MSPNTTFYLEEGLSNHNDILLISCMFYLAQYVPGKGRTDTDILQACKYQLTLKYNKITLKYFSETHIFLNHTAEKDRTSPELQSFSYATSNVRVGYISTLFDTNAGSLVEKLWVCPISASVHELPEHYDECSVTMQTEYNNHPSFCSLERYCKIFSFTFLVRIAKKIIASYSDLIC